MLAWRSTRTESMSTPEGSKKFIAIGWIGPATTVVEASSGSMAVSEAYFRAADRGAIRSRDVARDQPGQPGSCRQVAGPRRLARLRRHLRPASPGCWRVLIHLGRTGPGAVTARLPADPGVHLECLSLVSLHEPLAAVSPACSRGTGACAGPGGSGTRGSVPRPAAPACPEAAAPGPRCQQADTNRINPVTDTVYRRPAR